MPSDSLRSLPIAPHVMIPVGILGASIKPLPKVVALYLWHEAGCFHRVFYCHPGEVLSWLSISGSRAAAKVFSDLEQSGLIAVHGQNSGGGLMIELTENIQRLNLRSSQPALELFEPPVEFGGNPLLPRLLRPNAFLASANVTPSQKLIGWTAIWRGDIREKTLRIVYHELSRVLGIDRSNLRKAILKDRCLRGELSDFFTCSEVQVGPETLLRWTDRVFSDQQRNELRWLCSSNLDVAKDLYDMLYPGCEVIGAPVSPRLQGSTDQSEVFGAPVSPRLQGSTDQSEVFGAPVSPRLQGSTDQSEVFGAPVSPRLPAGVRVSPHDEVKHLRISPHSAAHGLRNINHSKSLNESLEIVGSGKSEIASSLKERASRLVRQVNLRGAYRWFVFAVVLLMETQELRVNGKSVGLSESDLATLIESCAGKNGRYFTGALKRRLAELLSPEIDFRNLSDSEQRRLADAVELPKLHEVRDAAKRLGYAWNDERMREEVQSTPERERNG